MNYKYYLRRFNDIFFFLCRLPPFLLPPDVFFEQEVILSSLTPFFEGSSVKNFGSYSPSFSASTLYPFGKFLKLQSCSFFLHTAPKPFSSRDL